MRRSRIQLLGIVLLMVVAGLATGCAANAEGGAAGVRARLSDDFAVAGWSDSRFDRVGARVCDEFPNGVFGDPRVVGTEEDPARAIYAAQPKPAWIMWLSPWIWQQFYDSYCS